MIALGVVFAAPADHLKELPGLKSVTRRLPKTSDAAEVLTELKQHFAQYCAGEERINAYPYLASLLRVCMDARMAPPQEAIAMLLEAGADVDAMDAELNMTPLVMAAMSRDLGLETLDKLLAAGADVNARHTDMSPLQAAAYSDRVDVCERIIAAGARLNERKGETKETALHTAAVFNASRVCEHLLTAGADVDAEDAKGATPLFYAIVADSPEVARILLAAGADPSLRSDAGLTALQVARQMERGRGWMLMLEKAENEHNKNN